MSYTIRYNRQTNHIDGIACKSTGGGTENGGVVASYALSACGSLTRGNLAVGKTYATIQEAYDAASKHTRRICKNCAKAALALIEAEAIVAEEAAKVEAEQAAQPEPAKVEGAEFQVGDKGYFLPVDRTHGYACPAGEVEVIRVVDHGEPTLWSPRFTYVVQVPGVPATSQGTDNRELHHLGKVPTDYRVWATYTTAVCGSCKKQVAYANTKIVSEPIKHDGPVYAGMCTVKETRVCVAC